MTTVNGSGRLNQNPNEQSSSTKKREQFHELNSCVSIKSSVHVHKTLTTSGPMETEIGKDI